MREDLKKQGWTTLGSRKKVYGKQLFDEMARLYPYKALLKISIPTILIHGTNDKYVPYEDAKNYVKRLKSGSLITIKDGEHGFQDRQQDRKIALQETLKFFLKYL